MTRISQIQSIPQSLDYYRNLTKEEIKFGEGGLHYREIPFEKCFDKNGYLLPKVKLSDDNLIYYYSSVEHKKELKFEFIQLD